MDVLLEILDPLFLDKAYESFAPYYANGVNTIKQYNASLPFSTDEYFSTSTVATPWPRDNVYRQIISILFLTQIGACSLYFIFSAMSYYLVFDRRLEHHPRFLKNQIRQEIVSSMSAVPFINILTLPIFLAEVRGKSLLYNDVSEYGWAWLGISAVLYMIFNDIAIYWIHRLEHHPSIYKYVHKPHHKWIVPTPWAALAFHPLDGWVQSTPYHVFVFLCPMQRHLYLALFVAIQIWTIFIHDGDMMTGGWTDKWLNSPAHHTLHHMYFTVNYGQYFTYMDSMFGSHRAPEPELDPLLDALKVMKKKGLIDEQGNPIEKPKKE